MEKLCIDHVNEDGPEHRKEMGGGGINMYLWLRRNGYPQDGRFQVLCKECNYVKHWSKWIQ